jgi:hypothetical protein
MIDLGDAGKKALKETGRKFGRELLIQELNAKHPAAVCEMHFEYLEGLLSSLFPFAGLAETETMMNNCKSCSYYAAVTK